MFNFGVTDNSSKTKTKQYAYQNQDSTSFARGGDSSRQDQWVYAPQRPGLASLYQQAGGVVDPWGAMGAATASQRDVLPGLQQGMAGLAGLMDPQEQIRTQAKSLSAGLGNLFSNEINPAIEGDAIGAGGFGGGRQGVAQGVAAGELGSAYTQGLGDITARANQTAVGASAAMPGLANSIYAARMGPKSAGMGVLGQYADILGAPTVMSRARSRGYDRSGSTSTGRAEDFSKSKTKSKDSGFKFGFGL